MFPVECQPSTAQNKLVRDIRTPSMIWNVVFVPGGISIPVSVVEHAVVHSDADAYQASPVDYLLNRNKVPQLIELQAWVSEQMRDEVSTSFQHSLDVLLHSFSLQKSSSSRKVRPRCCSPDLGSRLTTTQPEWRILLDRVHEMRCMFKIWATNNFLFYQTMDASPQELPWSVQAELKRIATSRMRSLELDILASLDKLLEPKEVKSLTDLQKVTVWACLMECILLYRELLAMPSANGAGFAQECTCRRRFIPYAQRLTTNR